MIFIFIVFNMHVAWSINEKDLKTLKSTEKIYIYLVVRTPDKTKTKVERNTKCAKRQDLIYFI
jgi:hypothetical protein